MGFGTLPKIDLNSERSEDSVIKTRSAFMRKRGFISREVDGSQDCGVDIYSEITNNGEATGIIFPIQIKSGKRGQIIHKKDGQYISLKFNNGRFGYLCGQIPLYGIIVFYDEENDILYFDYVRDLFIRLNENRIDDSWKSQEHIMLHIPIDNILDNDSIEEIRKSFLIIHENHLNLIQFKGPEYGVFPINSTSYESFGKIGIIRKLEKDGIPLFNNFQCAEIVKLLVELPNKDIFTNPKLLFLATIAYAEMGYLLDASLYRKKYFYLDLKKRLGPEFEEILIIYEFVIDHGLGYYNRSETMAKLLDLKTKITSPDNLSAIETHISMLKVEETLGDKIYTVEDVEEVVNVIRSIEKRASSETQKIIQKAIQSEILIHSISRLYADSLTDSYLYSMTPEPPEREVIKKYIIDIFDLIFKINKDALKQNEANQNNKIEAIAKHNIAKCYYSIYSSQYINRLNPDNKEKVESELNEGIRFALDSWQIYQRLSMFRDAYLAIREVYELYRLGEEYIDEKLDIHIKLDKIKKILNGYEQFDFYTQHVSTIDMYCNQINKHRTMPLPEISMENLEDMAPRLLQALHLPYERIENMKNDYLQFSNFNEHCDTSTLRLLSNQIKADVNDFWKESVRYLIRDEESEKNLIEGDDVINMLKQIGHYRE